MPQTSGSANGGDVTAAPTQGASTNPVAPADSGAGEAPAAGGTTAPDDPNTVPTLGADAGEAIPPDDEPPTDPGQMTAVPPGSEPPGSEPPADAPPQPTLPPTTDPPPDTPPDDGVFEPSFILGADISSVPEAMDSGTTYQDTDGETKSMLALLANHGFNYIRLRTFVNPAADFGYASSAGGCQAKSEPYNDKDHIVAFAQEVKDAGMGFLLDFHYSDTWADPAKQVIPESWRELSTIEALADQVYSYTLDVMGALQAVDALPDMVQVGNEITPGMLIHLPTQNTDCYGNDSVSTSPNGSTSNWDNLAQLLSSGIQAVREVNPGTKIMLHVESTDDLNGTRAWVQNAVSRGVDFDVLGLSCYTEWQGTPSVWETTFNALADEFPELSFVIAEYNPERTAANRVMRDLPDGRGLGTFFWEPTLSGAWGNAMFDWQGNQAVARSSDWAEYDALRTELGL